MTLFDMSGKVAVIHRLLARHRPRHRRADGRAWRKVVISSRKQAVCDEVAKAITTGPAKQVALSVAANISTKDDLRHLVEETNARVWQDRHAGLQRRIESLLRSASRHFRRAVSQILDNNIRRQSLADLARGAADDRAQGWIDHHHFLDRGLKGSTVLGAYAISKAADMQLARNLACEIWQHNVA